MRYFVLLVMILSLPLEASRRRPDAAMALGKTEKEFYAEKYQGTAPQAPSPQAKERWGKVKGSVLKGGKAGSKRKMKAGIIRENFIRARANMGPEAIAYQAVIREERNKGGGHQFKLSINIRPRSDKSKVEEVWLYDGVDGHNSFRTKTGQELPVANAKKYAKEISDAYQNRGRSNVCVAFKGWDDIGTFRRWKLAKGQIVLLTECYTMRR